MQSDYEDTRSRVSGIIIAPCQCIIGQSVGELYLVLNINIRGIENKETLLRMCQQNWGSII